jgi:hypothetical protein
MALLLQRAYRDRQRRLIVIVVAQEVFDAQGARIGFDRGREFTWADTDPRLYNAQGELRSKRAIVDGLKADIRAQLQAETTQPAPEPIEDYPGTGETV